MATKDTLKDLDLSSDEVERLTNAFKNEDFRKMFFDYAQEISDPENRKRYEEEIRQMEGDRGMDVQFIHPEPGHVIKTTVDGAVKAFINICQNGTIDKPSSEKGSGPDGQHGLSWKLPHSFAPPRDDIDKRGVKCKVFDFVVHPDTYRMAESNARFKKMLHDTAFDGIERQFNVNLDKKNIKFPKTKFKGTPTATVVRKKATDASGDGHVKKLDSDDIMSKFPYPYDTKTSAEKAAEREEAARNRELSQPNQIEKKVDEFTEPKYMIKHRTDFDIQDFRNDRESKADRLPTSLVVEIELPLLQSAGQLDLDIFEKRLTLESVKPAKYKLDAKLPYAVDENEGSAKFDKSKRKLIVTLPVIMGSNVKPEDALAGIEVTSNQQEEFNSVPQNEEIELEKRMSNGFHGNDNTGPTTKPQIEVLSQAEGTSISERNHIDEKEVDEPDDNFELPSPQVHYMMPNYDYQQDDESISIILHSGGVTHDSIEFEVDDDNHGCEMFMTSLGSGGFPVYYKLVVRFSENHSLEPNNCRVEVSKQNVVLILIKDDCSFGPWEHFQAGLDQGNLEEKVFVTAAVLRKQIDQLEQDAKTSETDLSPASEVTVTDLNSHSLKLDIHAATNTTGDWTGDEESPASDHDIEVIHSNKLPKLHSILKQRGRTQSESSCDDVLSSSYGRQHSSASVCSESSLMESQSDDNGSSESNCGLRKKCVSFSESIDRTTYKANQSVSSMTQALKSKRRRQRKRDARIEHKLERRRRKSSGSEMSSDDQPSSPDSVSLASSSPPLIIGDELSPGIEGDIEADMEEEFDRAIDAALKASASSDVILTEINVSKSEANPVMDLKTSDIELENHLSENPDSIGSQPLVGGAHNDNALRTKSVAIDVVGNNKGAVVEELDEDDDEEDMQHPNKADSALSWNDPPTNPEKNEHKTQCAFEFSNSVMYDLDEE